MACCYGFEVVDHWWIHKPDHVMTNDSGALMWDFTIITDGPVARNHPDITLVDKFSGAVQLLILLSLVIVSSGVRFLKRKRNILICVLEFRGCGVIYFSCASCDRDTWLYS